MPRNTARVPFAHLTFTSPGEDIPRLITGHKYGAGGQWALALRPHHQSAAVFHFERGAKLGTDLLRSSAPDGPTGRRALTAEQPHVTQQSAAETLRGFRQELPRATSAELRGAWAGRLLLRDGLVWVQLCRTIPSYGRLWVESVRGNQWVWSFQRAKRWRLGAELRGRTPASSLRHAIREGTEAARLMIERVCSVRDEGARAPASAFATARRLPEGAGLETDPFERLAAAAARRPPASKKATSKKAPAKKKADAGGDDWTPARRAAFAEKMKKARAAAARKRKAAAKKATSKKAPAKKKAASKKKSSGREWTKAERAAFAKRMKAARDAAAKERAA